jgi:Mg-chelatase subunit ChlI
MRAAGQHPLSKVPHIDMDVDAEDLPASAVAEHDLAGILEHDNPLKVMRHLRDQQRAVNRETVPGETVPGAVNRETVPRSSRDADKDKDKDKDIAGAAHASRTADAASGVAENSDRNTMASGDAPGSDESECQQREGESDDAFLIRTCKYCLNDRALALERLLHCDGIWLHALQYEGSGWCFRAPAPAWAADPFGFT